MLVTIKSMLALLLFCVAIGAIVSIFIFAIDVIKWHDREEKVNIAPSNTPEPVKEKESEVISDVDESREHNTSAFFDLGRES